MFCGWCRVLCCHPVATLDRATVRNCLWARTTRVESTSDTGLGGHALRGRHSFRRWDRLRLRWYGDMMSHPGPDPFPYIASAASHPDMVPPAGEPWWPDVGVFALSFNGYRYLGSVEACNSFDRSVRDRYRLSGEFPSNLSLNVAGR